MLEYRFKQLIRGNNSPDFYVTSLLLFTLLSYTDHRLIIEYFQLYYNKLMIFDNITFI